jgi:hypothetical protein
MIGMVAGDWLARKKAPLPDPLRKGEGAGQGDTELVRARLGNYTEGRQSLLRNMSVDYLTSRQMSPATERRW